MGTEPSLLNSIQEHYTQQVNKGMDRYVIVQAPSIEILAMMVDGYMGSGYMPTGGVAGVPDRGKDATGLVYLQAMYQPPKPPEDLVPPSPSSITASF